MYADRLFGLAICLLALLFILVGVPTIEQEATDYFTVGPRAFPYAAGVLTLLLGALVAAAPQERLPGLAALREPAARSGVARASLLALGYGVLLPIVGFTVASMVTLALLMLAFGERRWLVIAALALLSPPLLDLLFLRLFRLRLPDGLLGLSVF